MRRGQAFGGRLVVLGAAAVLVLSMAGDRGRAATVPAGVNGQDPLEVLELKVRPNVIVVLDSSGSMQSVVTEQFVDGSDGTTHAADHPRSKMWQAKQVLQQIVQQNQDKVSFQFGVYQGNGAKLDFQGAGRNRLQYATKGNAMPSTELMVRRAKNDSSGSERGLQSWQIIDAKWGTLYFEEDASPRASCAATLPGLTMVAPPAVQPKFYASGSALANDLKNAMNSATCSGSSRANSYSVSYDTGSGRFAFSSSGPRNFRILWNKTPNNIANAIGGRVDLSGVSIQRQTTGTLVNYSAVDYGLQVGQTCYINNSRFTDGTYWGEADGSWRITKIVSSTSFYLQGPTGDPMDFLGYVQCPAPSAWSSYHSPSTPWTLLYRDTGASNSQASSGTSFGGLDTRWQFTEKINSVDTTFYQIAAAHLFNGETIRVDSSGAVCGMSFGGAKTDPPSLTLQLADSSCNAQSGSAVFEYAGVSFSRTGQGCLGFRSKSDLVPCDLQSPPGKMQFEQIEAYLDRELPFNAPGAVNASGNPLPVGDPRDFTTNDATGAWGGANYDKPDGIPDYAESLDGGWGVQFFAVAPSAKVASWTPIANSLIDIKGLPDNTGLCQTNPLPPVGTYDSYEPDAQIGACVERGFSKLWNQGQAGSTSKSGNACAAGGSGCGPWKLDAIKDHKDPKEKTIVVFVTDGEDTCGQRGDDYDYNSYDNNALRAAYAAQKLYEPIDPAQPASSVQTYIVGYGGAFDATGPYRLNWIAWGGSGLGQGKPGQPAVSTDGNRWTEDNTSLKTKRAQCPSCQDAIMAGTADVLATKLQAIIDQGASDGEFNAAQSITESIYEYVDFALDNTGNYKFDPSDPATRFGALVPTRFISSFKMPGFTGQLKAYQNDGLGNTVQRWSAGDKLRNLVTFGDSNLTSCGSGGMCSCSDGATGECVFSSLPTKIPRRIYTTSRNGVYTYSAGNVWNYSGWTPPERRALWPPTDTAVVPGDYTTQGSLDVAMGLPADSSSDPAGDFTKLQKLYQACVGSNPPAGCSDSTASTRMKAARREAREMILAFMAGAAAVPEVAGGGVKRPSTGSNKNKILYTARGWILGDSELATVAVSTPPSLSEPNATPYTGEYRLFRDGVGLTPRQNLDTQIRQGFGLTRPDLDVKVPDSGRPLLKPVMSVVYAPANDMLHAFRAGPNCSSRTTTCAEKGGDELWGFVPYDELGALGLRLANEPQGRSNHVFMLARGVRFADVFVPVLPAPGTTSINIGGLGNVTVSGVWRRILYFGRGIGGKYVTALDVTAPGPYTSLAKNTAPPIPVWSRGNPDTQNGLASGTANSSLAKSPGNPFSSDADAYARMGETWSMPTVAFVNKGKTIANYKTTRRPDGVDFVIFMGSGYGNPAAAVREGTTHYTLDALTGDVVFAADVEAQAASKGIAHSVPDQVPYPNAIVANSVSFNRSAFESVSAKVFDSNPHPWSYVTTRVYVGDLHGRLWKFLAQDPSQALLAADLGADQPIGTAVALLGEGSDPLATVPNIFVTTGNDRRAQGPCILTEAANPCFGNFTLKDDGTDADTTVGSPTLDATDNVTTYSPVTKRFSRRFDQGDPLVDCGYPTEAVFRGTIQPTSAVECDGPLTGAKCDGNLLQRVFFGGTRLSLPNTKFAPPTPLACGGTGEYPCRSQFDSILYALKVASGQAAYDMNASGDDAYRIFRDSRIAAISVGSDPEPGRGGSSFIADEGLMKGTPKPPPPPGVPPTATSATANVVMRREPGQPPPAVRYGSTVCSEQP